jgi:hypothetical protein
MTIRDEIQLKMIILESKIDLAIIIDKDNQVPNRPDHSLSAFRAPHFTDRRKSSRAESKENKSDNHFYFSKFDYPDFSRSNPIK